MIKELLEGKKVRDIILEARADLPEEFQHMEFVVKGNKKIGKDTWILNMGSATDCPSRKSGECKICIDGENVECFAKTAERGYRPRVLPFRRRQDTEFHNLTAEEIVEDLMEMYESKKEKPRYLRISESGDFSSRIDVEKVFKIAELLDGIMRCYVYTARRSLDFHGCPYNLVVNGSSFSDEERAKTGVGNVFEAIPHDEYVRIFDSNWETPQFESPIEGMKCKGDCSICDYCKIHHEQKVYVEYH